VSNRVNGGCEELESGSSRLYEPHWDNFVECVKTRKRPICDVATAHNTSTICHMGTAAYVAGNASLEWDAENERFNGGIQEQVDKANEFLYRPYDNGWMLEKPYHKSWA
jgi:hypothetical protein